MESRRLGDRTAHQFWRRIAIPQAWSPREHDRPTRAGGGPSRDPVVARVIDRGASLGQAAQ